MHCTPLSELRGAGVVDLSRLRQAQDTQAHRQSPLTTPGEAAGESAVDEDEAEEVGETGEQEDLSVFIPARMV